MVSLLDLVVFLNLIITPLIVVSHQMTHLVILK